MKVDKDNQLVCDGSQNFCCERLASAEKLKVGGGDIEGEMVGLRTPLVCALASFGFMRYELLGSINQHGVVAYVNSGSTTNYISKAVAQQIGVSPDGKLVKLQMADTTTRDIGSCVWGEISLRSVHEHF